MHSRNPLDSVNSPLRTLRVVRQNTRHTPALLDDGLRKVNGLVFHVFVISIDTCPMVTIDRYNKYVKNLVRDMFRAEKNLAKSITVDSAVHFYSLKQTDAYSVYSDPNHFCFLRSEFDVEVTVGELHDLQYLGCPVTHGEQVRGFNIAMILGKHFRAGEWGEGKNVRCGSVVTCVINGRSLYARVLKFLKVDDDIFSGYASVRWFSAPTYVNPLCPRVTLDGSDIEREMGVNVLRISQIEPCQVSVERSVGGDVFYMIRDSGYDTTI